MAQAINTLPIGAKIRFGKHQVNNEPTEPIIWIIADKNHSGYPNNSVTLVTEKIIDIRAFDARETTNSDVNIATYGYNRYSRSNIRTWLNSEGVNWYNRKHT